MTSVIIALPLGMSLTNVMAAIEFRQAASGSESNTGSAKKATASNL
jgi:hypothetical protein